MSYLTARNKYIALILSTDRLSLTGQEKIFVFDLDFFDTFIIRGLTFGNQI